MSEIFNPPNNRSIDAQVEKAAAKYPGDRLKTEDSYIQRLKKLFLASVAGANAKTGWDKIAGIIESKAPIEEVLDALELPEYAPEEALNGIYLSIGKIHANHIADIVRSKAFKPKSRAAEWLQEFGASEVKYIDESQKEAIRGILAKCYEDDSYHRAAWQIKSYIGLDPTRAESLQKFADDLMAQGLSEKAAWDLAQVKGEELLMDRATTIATNECLTASRRASSDVTAEAVDEGILDPEEQEGVWLTVADTTGDDGRICDACRDAGGSTRELPDGVYEASGTQYTEIHIGDRCIEAIRNKVKKSLDYSNVMVPRLGGEISIAYRQGESLNPDSKIVLDLLSDESEGTAKYAEAAEKVKNPKLKELLLAHKSDEKVHNEDLEAWLRENDPDALVEKAVIAFLKADTCVSQKIKECMADGTPQDQAVAIAMRECGESKKALKKGDLTPEYLRAHYEAVRDHGDIHPQVKDAIHHMAKNKAGGVNSGKARKKTEDAEQEAMDAEVSGLKKCDGTVCEIEKFMPIVKVDEKEGKVYCVVAEPGFDLQGDYSTEKEITKSAHRFMERLQKTCGPGVGVHHERPIKAYVIENVVTQQPDIKLGDQVLKQGTWYQGHDLKDEPDILKLVISGEITGLSRQGKGRRVPITGATLAKAVSIAKSARVEKSELNYLLDEEIDRVDWVRKGANGKKIAIIKMERDVMTKAEPTEGTEKAGAGEAQVTKAEADLESIRKSLDELKKEKDKLDKEKSELQKENADLKKAAEGKEDAVKIAKDALAKVHELQEKAKNDRIEKSVEGLKLPGAKKDEVVALLKSAEDKLGLDSNEMKTLRGILDSTSEIVKASPMFKSLGTEGEGDENSPVAKFAALVDKELTEIRKDARNGGKSQDVLEAMATEKVSKEHRELMAEIYAAGSEGGV